MISFVTPNVLNSIKNEPFNHFNGDKPVTIINFNSIIEGYDRGRFNPLWDNDILIRNLISSEEESLFDTWYVEFLNTNTIAFKERVDMLRHVYNDDADVLLITDYDNVVSVNFVEALIKFISDTYGIRINLNLDPEAISFEDSDFSPEGLERFDNDLKTYVNVIGTKGLMSFE